VRRGGEALGGRQRRHRLQRRHSLPDPEGRQRGDLEHAAALFGDTFAQDWAQAGGHPRGDYALVKFEYEYDFSYGNCSKPAAQREPTRS
jgi:hypothetical protein